MTETPPITKTVPVALREDTERYAHISKRMLERGGVEWPPERIEALEKKIRTVRAMVNEQKTPAAILPMKIGEGRDGAVHYYRVWIASKPHTFVWSQVAKCVVSYAGQGELPRGIEPSCSKTS